MPSPPKIRRRVWRKTISMTIEADIVDIGDDVATALETIAQRLDGAGVAGARLDARLLVCAATGETAAGLIARPQRRLSAPEADLLSAMTAPVARLNAALKGRYAIEREFGEGGTGTVYLADDLKPE